MKVRGEVDEDETGAVFGLKETLHEARGIAFDEGADESLFLFFREQSRQFLALGESLMVDESQRQGDEGTRDEGRSLQKEAGEDSRHHEDDEERPKLVFRSEDSRHRTHKRKEQWTAPERRKGGEGLHELG